MLVIRHYRRELSERAQDLRRLAATEIVWLEAHQSPIWFKMHFITDPDWYIPAQFARQKIVGSCSCPFAEILRPCGCLESARCTRDSVRSQDAIAAVMQIPRSNPLWFTTRASRKFAMVRAGGG